MMLSALVHLPLFLLVSCDICFVLSKLRKSVYWPIDVFGFLFYLDKVLLILFRHELFATGHLKQVTIN